MRVEHIIMSLILQLDAELVKYIPLNFQNIVRGEIDEFIILIIIESG